LVGQYLEAILKHPSGCARVFRAHFSLRNALQSYGHARSSAEANNIGLSRLIEFMLSKVTDKRYRSLDELPVSDWIQQVAEGEVTYVRKNAAERNVKKDYLSSRRKR